METILPWILKLGGGVLGSNVIGGVLKKLSLGGIGNTIVGLIGGGLGPMIMNLIGIGGGGTGTEGTEVAAATEGMDMGAMLSTLGQGAAGGGILTPVIGMLKQMFGGKKSD